MASKTAERPSLSRMSGAFLLAEAMRHAVASAFGLFQKFRNPGQDVRCCDFRNQLQIMRIFFFQQLFFFCPIKEKGRILGQYQFQGFRSADAFEALVPFAVDYDANDRYPFPCLIVPFRCIGDDTVQIKYQSFYFAHLSAPFEES